MRFFQGERLSNEKQSKPSLGGRAAVPSVRAGLLSVGVVLVAILGGVLGLGRDRIVIGLASVPSPREMKVIDGSAFGQEATGARSVTSARRLVESGDLAGAKRLLSAIPKEDPAFPAAERLRSEIDGLSTPGGRR